MRLANIVIRSVVVFNFTLLLAGLLFQQQTDTLLRQLGIRGFASSWLVVSTLALVLVLAIEFMTKPFSGEDKLKPWKPAFIDFGLVVAWLGCLSLAALRGLSML